MINGPGAMQQAVAARRTQIGGDWFFWIAGISLAVSVLAQFGTVWHSAFGLGTTALIDAGRIGLPKSATIALDVLSAGFYVLYGFFARKGALWAFIAGAVFYLLDAVLLVSFSAWLAVAFHAYALFRIFQGFQAAQQLNLLRKQSVGFAASGYVPPPTNPSNDVWPRRRAPSGLCYN